jgi:hypothetical protein
MTLSTGNIPSSLFSGTNLNKKASVQGLGWLLIPTFVEGIGSRDGIGNRGGTNLNKRLQSKVWYKSEQKATIRGIGSRDGTELWSKYPFTIFFKHLTNFS